METFQTELQICSNENIVVYVGSWSNYCPTTHIHLLLHSNATAFYLHCSELTSCVRHSTGSPTDFNYSNYSRNDSLPDCTNWLTFLSTYWFTSVSTHTDLHCIATGLPLLWGFVATVVCMSCWECSQASLMLMHWPYCVCPCCKFSGYHLIWLQAELNSSDTIIPPPNSLPLASQTAVD